MRERVIYIIILSLAILVNLTGLLNDLFISDSALYASIAKEMATSNNFLDLTYDGLDWLDKPHLQFWITAISFKTLGINVFAYKLPAILFTLVALLYTYKLAGEIYDQKTALLAVLILATAEHLVISNNDVRAEPYLTGLIIASIYYYHRSIREFRFLPILLASFFAGLAVMTKGLFSLIPIVGAIGGELIIKRNWSSLFSWRWLLSLGLLIFFIIPELYALYHQFDSHPEKLVFGRTGVSGIRFFLWDSQFGRFFNTGPIKGQGDPLFFLHTLLWAFLPWAVLMYYSLYRKIRDNLPMIRNSFSRFGDNPTGSGDSPHGPEPDREFLTISGIVLSLLVFSLSKFQLPHYSNVIFPLLAILTAGLIQQEFSKAEMRFWKISQWIMIFLIMSAVTALHILYKPGKIPFILLCAFMLSAAGVFLVTRSGTSLKMKIFYYSCLASVLLNFYLNLSFYPDLLEYQSGIKAAEYMNVNQPGKKIRTLGVISFTVHFHAESEVRDLRSMNDLISMNDSNHSEDIDFILFTREAYLDSLEIQQIDYNIVELFDHYHTTMLSGTFLNHKTRKEALHKQYLLSLGSSE